VKNEGERKRLQRPSGVEGLDGGVRNVEVSIVDRLLTKFGLSRRSPHYSFFGQTIQTQWETRNCGGTGAGLVGWLPV